MEDRSNLAACAPWGGEHGKLFDCEIVKSATLGCWQRRGSSTRWVKQLEDGKVLWASLYLWNSPHFTQLLLITLTSPLYHCKDPYSLAKYYSFPLCRNSFWIFSLIKVFKLLIYKLVFSCKVGVCLFLKKERNLFPVNLPRKTINVKQAESVRSCNISI